MIDDDRARLTLVDIIHIGISIAVLSFLGRPFYAVLTDNSGALSTGPSLLMQAIIPAVIVTLLVVIFTVAVGGSA